MGKVTAPEPLTAQHDSSSFDCGASSLNDWLQKQALKNAASGATRTFVVCENQEVIGYYALATGGVARQEAPGNIRRRMPDPIPVIVLGRLAVDLKWQRSGIGPGLLKDAVIRAVSVSQQVGVRALLVHALDEKAKGFYTHHGFIESPMDPMTLMLSLKV
jgi:predicted N-acetyltransferase YhbS